jgi:hypothetical protein
VTVSVVTIEVIERRIYLIRGQKVMLDADLAQLYEVPTKVLNQAVRRNVRRFPEDRKISALEHKYDEKFKVVFTALRKLIAAPQKPRREIGFKTGKRHQWNLRLMRRVPMNGIS